MCYAVYLRRWILPNWGKLELRDVRTIEFESWLRRPPLAKESCAKIRGVMSVLFNHACRYEFFDHNPIRLVRQGAKRKAAPNILNPDEIKTLIDGLASENGHWFCSLRRLDYDRTFRHSFGTLPKANGEDVKTVQELLRHANSRITLDVYTQAVNSNKRAAQSKVVRMMVSNVGQKVEEKYPQTHQ